MRQSIISFFAIYKKAKSIIIRVISMTIIPWPLLTNVMDVKNKNQFHVNWLKKREKEEY
jgi:hypothetical protein